MKFRPIACWGKQSLALTALLVSTQSFAATDSTPHQANVQIKTDLTHLLISVDQGAPLPPGGCNAGFEWNTTHGGCRRADIQPESAACPTGYTGSRTRYRTAYILQANSNDVAYDAWGAWQENCTAPRAAGVLDTVIASLRGEETGEHMVNNLSGNIAQLMRVNYGTKFGVTIHRPTAELNCIFASGSSGSSDTSSGSWSGTLLPPGDSISKSPAGYCRLSNQNQTAELFGSCDSTSGGDGDGCTSSRAVVNITAVNGCTVSTEARKNNIVIAADSYDICE